MKVQELTIVGPGPTGADILTLNAQGMRAVGAAGGVYSAFDVITVPLLAATVDGFIWVCHEGLWQVSSVAEGHTTVGGAGATVNVVVCPQGSAIGSGTAQLSAALDLTVTAPAVRFGTLINPATIMSRGDALALDLSGTLGSLVGTVSVQIKRIG